MDAPTTGTLVEIRVDAGESVPVGTVLAVIVWRRLPLSYGLFSVAIVVTSLAAGNLNSTERYGLNAFPLVMALALVTPTRLAERVTSAVCAVGLAWMCALAWLAVYVP